MIPQEYLPKSSGLKNAL